MDEANLSLTLASIMMLDDQQLDNLFIYLQELAIALQNTNPIFKDALDMNLRSFLAPFDNRQIDGMSSYYESIGLNLKLIKTHQIMYGGVSNELVPLTYMPEINTIAIQSLYDQINLNSNAELSFIGIGLKEYTSASEEMRSQIMRRMTATALTVAITDWRAKKLTIDLIDDAQFTSVSKQQMIKAVDANIQFLTDLKKTAIELKDTTQLETQETFKREMVSKTMQLKETELEIKLKGLETDKKSMSHAIKLGATGGITVGIILFLALQQFVYSSGVVAFNGAMGTIDIGQMIGLAAQSKIKSWTGIDLDILKELPKVADEMNKLLATNKETYIKSLNQLKDIFQKEQTVLENKTEQWKSDIETKEQELKTLSDEEKQLRTYINDIAQLKNNINFLERKIDQATQDTKSLEQIKTLQNKSQTSSDAWSKLKPELLPECLASNLMPNTCDVTSSLMYEPASKPTMSSQVYLAKLLQHRDNLMRQRGNVSATLKSLPSAPWFDEDPYGPARQKNNIMLNGLNTQIDILNKEIEILSKSVKDEINVLEREKTTMEKNPPRIPVKISVPKKQFDENAELIMAGVEEEKEQLTKEVKDTVNKLEHFEKFEKMMENIGTKTKELATASEEYAKISKEYREASAKQSRLDKVYEYGMKQMGRTTPFSLLEQSKEISESNYYQQSVEYLTNVNDIYNIATESINTNDQSQIPFFATKTAQNITENIKLMNSLTYSIDETGPDLSPATARLIAQHRHDQAWYSEGIKSQLTDPRTKYYETLDAATTAVDSIAVMASTLVGAFAGVMLVKALRQSSSNKSGGNKKTRKHKRKMSKTVRKNKIKRIKSHKQKHNNKTRK